MSDRPSSDFPSPVDEGASAVAGAGRRELGAGAKFGVLVLVGVLALGYIWFEAKYGHKSAPQDRTTAAAYTSGGEQYNPPPATAAPVTPVRLPQPAPESPSNSFLGTNTQPSPASAPIMAYSGADNLLPALAPSASASGSFASNASGQGQSNPNGASLTSFGPDNSLLAARLKPTMFDAEQATILKNPDMVITEGTMIPCILQTAIDSQLPGLVTCIVPIDIRGTTGNVVLLDRGTKIVGQIQSGLLQGQNRVFVDWTRAETPEHVLVTLDSPGSDELGRAGLPGAVNNHFWQRFGGALMLTLVQGGLDAATIAAAGQGSSNSATQQAGLGFVYAAQSNGQSAADTALRNSINIAPTLAKNQGDTVSLIVAHDLDFSSAYQLQVNGAANGEAGHGG